MLTASGGDSPAAEPVGTGSAVAVTVARDDGAVAVEAAALGAVAAARANLKATEKRWSLS